uniref:Uncharacterized protein n=1 Tax=Knipowitschia caucasica TaxID=637954 RepID=A0AAV2MHB9_KNICA
MQREFIVLGTRILTQHLSVFKPFKHVVVHHMPHQYSEDMSKCSTDYPLGLLFKDENKTSDLVDTLRHIQKECSNAKQGPHAAYNAYKEFVRKDTAALFLAAAMEHWGLEDVTGLGPNLSETSAARISKSIGILKELLENTDTELENPSWDRFGGEGVSATAHTQHVCTRPTQRRL